MKELDFNKITAEIKSQLEQTDFDITNLLGETMAIYVVLGIYLTNDILDAHGQDFKELGVSVITTKCRCSVIVGPRMSWMKSYMPICGYINLHMDIESILMIIQACFDRIDL